MRRRATLKLTSLKSLFASRTSRLRIPEKTGRIAAFSALFVLSALITLIVLLSGRNGGEAKPKEEDAPVSSVQQIIEDFSGQGAQAGQLADTLSVQDFILPQTVKGDSPEPHLLRPRLERWQEEQINRYWIPLEDIARDLIRRENDRRIEELFEGVP